MPTHREPRGLIFHPEKTHRMESLWSVWLKACTWNHVSARMIVGALRRLGEWMNPGEGAHVAAFGRFGLPAETLPFRTPEGVLGWLPAKLSAPARIVGSGIRVCPRCFSLGYHFPLFQIAAYTSCPEHGLELVPLSTIAGVGLLPSSWDSIPAPRDAAWWPAGYKEPGANHFPAIEQETLRILRARETYNSQLARGTQIFLFPTWEGDSTAASLFEHHWPRPDYESMHGEAFHLFIELYSRWGHEEPSIGKYLRLGVVTAEPENDLWGAVAQHVSPGLADRPRDPEPAVEDMAPVPLSALIRQHPELRIVEGQVPIAARSFASDFHREHGACFHDKQRPGELVHVPCAYCRAYLYWEHFTRSRGLSGESSWVRAQDLVLGRIAGHLLGQFPKDVAAKLTILCYRSVARVWTRALYLAVLAPLRRPDAGDFVSTVSIEYERLQRSLCARSIIPPAILDLSGLPNCVRVHYLASVHDQPIPESAWDVSHLSAGVLA